MPATIELRHVTVERQTIVEGQLRSLRVLSDVNFTVPIGGRTVIFGPSGAGKSSLLRTLNRLDEPIEGEILLDGVDIRRLDPIPLRRRVGMVFQQPFLFDETVEENLAYPLRLQKHTLSRDDAVVLLHELGLPSEMLGRRGQQLSGGQQQRVAVARALTLNPDVLLLDEPSSALDEESARLLIDALLARNASGMSLVMVSHSPEAMRRMGGQGILVHHQQAQVFADIETALQEARQMQVQVN